MRRTVPALLLAVALVLAGCAGAPAGTVTESPTDATESPTEGPPVSAEYVVRGGDVPDEFASVTVTLRVVFVRQADDLGPCYPDVFTGPYKPTITPLGTPRGECLRSETVEVTLTDGGERTVSLDRPGPVRGHAVILTDLTARLENGTSVTDVKDIGGAELLRERGTPSGRYGIEVGIGTMDSDVDYDYYVDGERFDP